MKIDPHPDPGLPNVFNLGFGPDDGNEGLLDLVRLKHTEPGRVFSTVLFHGLTFLRGNPTTILGIDGSDDARSTLYHLMFKTNRKCLSSFFESIGVDWYVRVFRNWDYELNESGDLFARPKMEPFNYDRARHDLYRYYMFKLKTT